MKTMPMIITLLALQTTLHSFDENPTGRRSYSFSGPSSGSNTHDQTSQPIPIPNTPNALVYPSLTSFNHSNHSASAPEFDRPPAFSPHMQHGTFFPEENTQDAYIEIKSNEPRPGYLSPNISSLETTYKQYEDEVKKLDMSVSNLKKQARIAVQAIYNQPLSQPNHTEKKHPLSMTSLLQSKMSKITTELEDQLVPQLDAEQASRKKIIAVTAAIIYTQQNIDETTKKLAENK